MHAILITYSIEVPGKMINDVTATVKKILRTCTGKQTIEGVPVLESLSTIFHHSLFTTPAVDLELANDTTRCALQVISNTLEIALQKFLLNV